MEYDCVFCSLPTPGCREENCLKCTECDSFCHFSCLFENVNISDNALLGDVFYKFTCRSCSPSHVESVKRDKLSWLTVLILALYNLQEQAHLSRHGYFHWKLHITDFIDRKWNSIFGSAVRRKRTWHGTVSGTLSHYSPMFFQTGSDVLREPGWWKLTHSNLSPFKTIMLKYDTNTCSGRRSNLRGTALEDNMTITSIPHASFSSGATGMLNNEYSSPADMDLDMLNYSDSESLDVDMDFNMEQNPFSTAGFPHLDTSLSDLVDLCVSSEEVVPYSTSGSQCNSRLQATQQSEIIENETDTESSDNETACAPPSRSLFVCQPRRPLPWIQKPGSQEPCDRAEPMAEYDELQLLHKLSKYVEKNNVDVPQNIRRLYRKLCVRREQRHRRLPSFNENLSSVCNLHIDEASALSSARTLDRYQVLGTFKGKSNSTMSPNPFMRLLGQVEPTCFVSPYTERVLKPFIRRDFNCRPLRLKLLAEIREKVNSENPSWRQPKQHSIDYSYVQPQHIPAINSLCEMFFWPGIDLSESLHYPDFSCVALYRKLVIGFAFMVPDVSNNESYISFLFTHPEWRRAGIATFMLYHIIQTCMGKDVTLHVSVTNPAIILYQKFGFKVEELAQDFYDKYLSNDSKECRHALFLRLSR